jgi:hypothetical protein
LIEENFIRLYARDFVMLSVRSELGQPIESQCERKVTEARSHSQVMDARKGSDHLAALTVRLREEADRFDGRGLLAGADPIQAAERRHVFLNGIADQLATTGEIQANALADSLQLAPVARRTRRA